ncbi:MAG: cytochrome P450 [Chlamydiales bacterium]|nr:cytochrome P450 [Chlamydiales bacterium]
MEYLNDLNTQAKAKLSDFFVYIKDEMQAADSWSDLISSTGHRIMHESSRFFGVMPLNSQIIQQEVVLVDEPVDIEPNRLIIDPAEVSDVLRSHRSACPYQVNNHNALGFEYLKRIFPDLELNDGILWCDEAHTKIYRQLLLNFITPKAVQEWRHEVRNLAKAELESAGAMMELQVSIPHLSCKAVCQCLLGYHGDVATFSNAVQAMFRPEMYYMQQVALETALRMSVNAVMDGAMEGGLVHLMRIKGFSGSQIKAMIILLVIAGQQTTSTVLKYAARESAENTVRRDQFCQQSIHQPERASETLDRFILESLRVSMPVKDIKRYYADGEQEKLGKVQEVGIAAMSQCPRIIGASPHSFDPDRAIFDQIPSFLPSLPWFPFGAQRGAHTCIGWRFFMMEAQEFLQEFWLKYDSAIGPTDTLWLSKRK